jgi:M6 family metalloprotease-like protein
MPILKKKLNLAFLYRVKQGSHKILKQLNTKIMIRNQIIQALWLILIIFSANQSVHTKPLKFPCIATAGTTRCLVVFTKFKDDDFGRDLSQGGAECLQDSVNSWLWNLNTLPPFAKKVIDSIATDSPTTGSLTEYFYLMSGGRFFLIGDVYPELLIPIFEQKFYSRKNRRGLAWFNRKILEGIDSKVDFQRYDSNPRDGQADMIMLLFRLLKSRKFDEEKFQGKAFLGGFDPITLDSVVIDGRVFGSGFTSDCSKFTGIKLLAHEIGHYLLGSGHRHGIGEFGLMGQDGYSAMCAREREYLGWISPKVITQSVFSDTLTDLTTTGDARKIFLNQREYLLLANRQRISFFEQQIDEPCKQGELPATGLVISHVWGRHPNSFKILAPDGKIVGNGDKNDTWQPGSDHEFDSIRFPRLRTRKPANVRIQITNLRASGYDIVYDLIIEEIGTK